MDSSMPDPEWPELPELLQKVGKIIGLVEDNARFLLLLHGYLPPGTLQSDVRLRRAREILGEILEPAAAGERAGHASLSRGYPAPPSTG